MNLHARKSIIAAALVALASAAQAQATDAGGSGAAAVDTPPRTGPVGTNVQTITNPNVLGENTRRVFARLDPRHTGYLTRDAVGSDAYLSSHFDECDTNRDGQLSRSEVSVCLRGQQR